MANLEACSKSNQRRRVCSGSTEAKAQGNAQAETQAKARFEVSEDIRVPTAAGQYVVYNGMGNVDNITLLTCSNNMCEMEMKDTKHVLRVTRGDHPKTFRTFRLMYDNNPRFQGPVYSEGRLLEPSSEDKKSSLRFSDGLALSAVVAVGVATVCLMH